MTTNYYKLPKNPPTPEPEVQDRGGETPGNDRAERPVASSGNTVDSEQLSSGRSYLEYQDSEGYKLLLRDTARAALARLEYTVPHNYELNPSTQ